MTSFSRGYLSAMARNLGRNTLAMTAVGAHVASCQMCTWASMIFIFLLLPWTLTLSRFVMAGHSRSKNGIASLAYVPAIHVLQHPPMRAGYVYIMTNKPNGILYTGVT